MKKTIVIIGAVGALALTLAIVIVVVWTSRTGGTQATSRIQWYIKPLSERVRFTDSRKDAAGIWLLGMPMRASYMELLERSPYSYDEWLACAQRIEHLEASLVDFYEDPNCGISRSSILDALFEVGTMQSVPVLIESVQEDNLSNDQKNRIAAIIGKNGDATVVRPLVSLIEEIQLDESSPDSERMLKLNLLSALLSHAPQTAEEYLQSMRQDPSMQRYQWMITYLMEIIQQVKMAN